MPKIFKRTLITLLLAAGLLLAFTAACGVSVSDLPESQDEPNEIRVIDGLDFENDPELGQEVVEQAWGIILDAFVENDEIDTGALSEAAIRGMLEELDDPYSSYIPAETFELSMSDI